MPTVSRVFLALAAATLLTPAAATAQQTCTFLCAPVFVLQPGLIVTNFLDAPENVDSETDFNFRFVTAIPTAVPRTTLVAIVQWTPFNNEDIGGGEDFNFNAPGIVYGPVFNVFNTPLLGFDFDVLGAYGPAGEADDESFYTHKLVLEGDLFLKIGQMMAMENDRWKSLSLYAFLAYVATGIPNDADPWVLLTGLSLPIAP